MASIDVVNLFTNVPVDKALNLVKNNLTEHSEMNSKTIDKIISLLQITLNSSQL